MDDEEKIKSIYEATGEPPQNDGTYRRLDDTIVCDACYVRLGMPPLAELESRIFEARIKFL